jgi:acetoin:2,6-dichlorophenolindophenol oxidoreductase subunit alpha
MNLPRETLRNLYFQMLRIRKFQLRVESHYLENEMKTPIHLYIGQEAIAVGVCAHLRKDDYISSSHRSHGHYLAKGGNAKALIAELYCRETGCSKGRGGSMHLVDVSVGHYGSSSIVGGGIPIGTGMALAIQMKKQNRVSVVFLSDGAADDGVRYESLIFAVLKKLPVIYILENNQYSVCSPVSARQAGDNVFHALTPPLLFSEKIDGNDVLRVHEIAGRAVERARAGLGPSFIECRTYRIRGHAGCESQDFRGYRDPAEVEEWKSRCPLSSFEKKLGAAGLITGEEIRAMEGRIEAELDEAFSCARQDPLPDGKNLHLYLFCE